MAIYRLEVKSISRRDGRSATAAAAYRSAERITDDRTGEIHDYRRRGGVAHTEMILPDHAPQDFSDRSIFWNGAEAAERRKDSKVARDLIAALPHELDDQQRIQAGQSMARHLMERYGVGVDLAIHAPDREADQRNWHAHMLISTRQVDADGFGAKTRQLDVKQSASVEVQHMRERWADLQNRALEHAGRDERVDHRSNAEQGLDRIPEPKLGPVATDMERSGRPSKAGDDLRRVRGENAALQAALAQRKVIDLEIERERRRILQAEQEQAQNDRQEADRFSVAARLEQEFGQQGADLTRQAEDLQTKLDRQNSLQRFWFNLTGRNDRDRIALEEVRRSQQELEQRRSEARAQMEAHQQAQEIVRQVQQHAQEAQREHQGREATNKQPERLDCTQSAPVAGNERSSLEADFSESAREDATREQTLEERAYEEYRERFNAGEEQRSQARGRDIS